ncbi:hypothetical protein K461DRAFT_274893 [Myriangium duriaei CBS 260.36]|uniref:Aminoglycoside phosphotransferase domain-containing protein n=1 Tax=Myriangium duriaei CBS 260.36 TaxID=1168546 RepID=A0A9P4J5M4_9PEZI|nr:hypothetical protein K461DRAFT_274893 [Myriangium duriaei CBS 260.36]
MEAGDGQDSRMRLPVVRSLAKVLSRGRVCDDSTSVVDHLLRPHLQLILSSDDPVICPFQQAAGFLYGKLDSLKGLPLFLSHFDLNDMNIMVSDDFEVSGLIDWEFSSPLPFGVGFSRIDSLAGEYHEGCFCMLDDFEEVERAFWSEILKGIPESTRLLVTETPELVQTAVTLGILLEAFQLENGRLGPYSEVAVRALPKLLTYRIPMIRGPDSPPYSI